MIVGSLKIFFLIWFVGSVVYVQQRGKVKAPFRRRIAGFVTLLAPFNIFWYLFSRVPNEPFINRKEFPELQVLRDNWETIRDEVVALNEQGHVKSGAGVAFRSFYNDDRWRRFYLTWYGKEYQEAKRYMPKTLAMINNIPSINSALIARLNPGKTLKPHRDPFSVSLRYHLGLVTPNSAACRIIVDGETYFWKDGEDVIFDETFIHEATNGTNEERLILFCDLQRPMRGAISTWFALRTHKIICFLTAGDNNEQAQKSTVNGFYDRILYPAFQKTRVFKKRFRKSYYATKFLLYAGIVWLIFF